MFKIIVLVSGSGTNMLQLIKNDIRIDCIIADRECKAKNIADEYNIDFILLNRDKEISKNLLKIKIIDNKLANEIIDSTLERCKTDYIVLAGYLSILTEKFIKKWDKRVINIHPSLLPKFGGKGMYGIKVHEAVIKAGEKESGCTVHFVTNEIDAGEIITNVKVPVLEDDTPETLQKRVLEQEHKLLIKGIKKIL